MRQHSINRRARPGRRVRLALIVLGTIGVMAAVAVATAAADVKPPPSFDPVAAQASPATGGGSLGGMQYPASGGKPA